MLRRSFIKWLAATLSFAISGCLGRQEVVEREAAREKAISKEKSRVYLVKTESREEGVRELLDKFELSKLSGKRVALKANYNSADPFPASTHPDILAAIVQALKGEGASVVVAERSGMGYTRTVLEKLGVMEFAEELGFDVVVLDGLGAEQWLRDEPEGSHWSRGYLFPKVFSQAHAIVQTCCLKTHRYGGHFSMSLKNSVGMVAEEDLQGHDYMAELHRSPYQRQMIAEINTSYEPELIVMDAMKGFSTGGPAHGTLIEPGVMLAGRDRVALDAVGVALLRHYGTTQEVSRGKVFQQDQIARAVELGLGVASPERIEVVPVKAGAREICTKIEEELGG